MSLSATEQQALEQLQPLLPAAPIGLWPPAIGWWLLPFVLLLLVWASWRLGQRWQTRQRPVEKVTQELDAQRQAALQALQALPKPYQQDAGPWLQQLNELLKRVCLAHYPDAGSHTLSGRQWLAFLDSRCPAAGLTRWMVLVDGAYRSRCQLDDKAIDELALAVATWIRKHV